MATAGVRRRPQGAASEKSEDDPPMPSTKRQRTDDGEGGAEIEMADAAAAQPEAGTVKAGAEAHGGGGTNGIAAGEAAQRGAVLGATREEDDERGGELCTIAGCNDVVELPREFFKIKSLSSILNWDSWNQCLEGRERAFLRSFLPSNFDEAGLDKIFQEDPDFHFGNPVTHFMRDVRSGLHHPDVVKYRHALEDLHYAIFFHTLRDHHDTMVTSHMCKALVNGNGSHAHAPPPAGGGGGGGGGAAGDARDDKAEAAPEADGDGDADGEE